VFGVCAYGVGLICALGLGSDVRGVLCCSSSLLPRMPLTMLLPMYCPCTAGLISST
jgi:hypothetical protein